jgi:hypothetical protein
MHLPNINFSLLPALEFGPGSLLIKALCDMLPRAPLSPRSPHPPGIPPTPSILPRQYADDWDKPFTIDPEEAALFRALLPLEVLGRPGVLYSGDGGRVTAQVRSLRGSGPFGCVAGGAGTN